MSQRGWVLFAMMSVIWGIPYLLIKIAIEDISNPMLVFVRTAVGAAVLLPLVLRGGQLAGLAKHWRPLAVFAVIEIIGPWWLVTDAERRVSSSMTGLIIASVPILAVVVTKVMGDGERLGARRWAGLAIGFAGVAVLIGPELSGDALSIVELLLVACGYAIASLVVARWLKDVPGLPMTAVCLAAAAVFYAPAAALTWPDTVPSARVLGALMGLAVVCTAIAFITFFALIREVGASRAMVFTYVNPAVAVTAGVIFLGEPLTVTILIAFVLTVVGSVLATARRTQRDTPPEGGAQQRTADESTPTRA